MSPACSPGARLWGLGGVIGLGSVVMRGSCMVLGSELRVGMMGVRGGKCWREPGVGELPVRGARMLLRLCRRARGRYGSASDTGARSDASKDCCSGCGGANSACSTCPAASN